MSISFDPSRWNKIRETFDLWWEGKLERPIIPVVLEGRDPGRKQPNAPLLTQETCADLDIPVRDLIDRIDFELSKQVYIGDAFPFFNLSCFGPGVTAAFLGAELDTSSGRVWFHPKEIVPISEIHMEYNPENVWLCRIKEICFEAMNHWQGQVLVGMPDLGGVLDILSTLRIPENLLMDLYDHPDEVLRLSDEIQELWHQFYNEINEVLQPVNPGYSDWSGVYSSKPSYIIQNDFCYMISPEMFDVFAKKELETTCKKLDHTIYHLDGVGQLAHLDSLLEIKELDAVQWVPGDGKPPQAEWPEVLIKIHNAGKGLFIGGGFESIDKVMNYLGTGRGINHSAIHGNVNQQKDIQKKLAEYGIE